MKGPMRKPESGVMSKILATISLGFLAACSTSAPDMLLTSNEALSLPTETPAFAGARPDIIEASDIYRLSDAQEDAFLAYFNRPSNRRISKSERLARYLKKSTGAFEYQQQTRTAGEVLFQDGGNCLSLANLTTAMARVAGIEVGYQLITDTPIFALDGNIVVRSVHVRSKLKNGVNSVGAGDSVSGFQVWTVNSGVIIDYFPSGNGRFIRNISESEFSAMYFRNLAAEALSAQDYARAFWLTTKSLELAPDHADGINMLAVLYRRTGDDRTAEAVYEYGVGVAGDKIALLKNYKLLLDEQGRAGESTRIAKMLAEYQDQDPFEWWFMAEDAYNAANYDDALSFYGKSVKIAPYLHEGYFGLAKTHYQLGNLVSARRAMRRAVENASRLSTRTTYEAKLMALSGQ